MQTLFDKYEDLNMTQYTEGKQDLLVFNNPESTRMKEQMDHMIDNQKNSFDHMYHWCKGEMYDIKAIVSAIAFKENFEKTLKKTETKKSNTQTDLENVNQGKKTIRTLLKNEKDAGGLQSTIENTEKELENLDTIIAILTSYMGEQVIPKFKKEKLKIYHKLMQQFTVIEINNAHQTASFWSTVLQNPNVKNSSKA
jgi:hypothetical protein